jgi:hypothetical protein
LVLLKCYQRLGYFPRLDVVPADLAGRIRAAAELGVQVEPRYGSERTLTHHRAWIRTRLGVTYEPTQVRAIAESAMREALMSKDNPADVINVALETLTRQRCELPGYTTLDEMCSAVRAEVNGRCRRRKPGLFSEAVSVTCRPVEAVFSEATP